MYSSQLTLHTSGGVVLPDLTASKEIDMKKIQTIETIIREGNYHEPVARFRVYRMINSVRHLLAGSDWQLMFSTSDLENAEEFTKKGSDLLGDLYVIVDGETHEIQH
jgi:hypothetical protein